MISKRIAILFVGLALAGCSSTGGPADGPDSNCTGGKCDAFAPPALGTTDAVLGECTVVPDLETEDLFFARDQLDCTLLGFDESVPAKVNSLILDTRQLTTGRNQSARFDTEELDGTTRTAAAWSADAYPLRMTVRPIMYVETSSGSISSPSTSGQYILPELTFDALNRAEEPQTHSLDLDLRFDQVVVWPTRELADSWAAGEHRFALIRITSELDLGEQSKTFSFSRHASGDDDLSPLPKTIFSVPVNDRSPAFIEVHLDSSDPVGAIGIDGPGYFLLDSSGQLTKATPEEIEAQGMFERDSDVVPPTDDPDATEPAPPVEPVDPEPTIDPCNGACDATQACVAAACVPLEDQRQYNCNSSPNAACEEDADCASANVCAEGLCRLLECQTQITNGSQCYDATRVCEQDTDCADGHACAEGLCRRLTCQTQITSGSQCYDPTRVCEQTSDCAEGHSCVEGLCRRLSCQTQLTNGSQCYDPTRPCAADTDCESGHACVENLCRRLTCQTQLTNGSQCYEPTRPCETTSDCGEGHVCEEDVCKRLTCID